MDIFLTIVLIYILGINIFTFFLFWFDKIKAIRVWYRISEDNLLKYCSWGWSLWGFIGMLVFHHKVQKPSFQKRFYVLFAIQAVCVLAFVLLRSFM